MTLPDCMVNMMKELVRIHVASSQVGAFWTSAAFVEDWTVVIDDVLSGNGDIVVISSELVFVAMLHQL